MPKIARELTALQVKNLKNPGLHAVGGVPGLLIKIGKQSASFADMGASLLVVFNGLRLLRTNSLLHETESGPSTKTL